MLSKRKKSGKRSKLDEMFVFWLGQEVAVSAQDTSAQSFAQKLSQSAFEKVWNVQENL